ncbi:pep-cterm sorting domain-containing protein [Anaeramoeba flamelloides]|uniref:Pep-cterm sorting domain-containing protein n=1 Tax=Anaeramoeba flamelloides TaxID=1746091 RepID=A0AAV7YBM6_9EUKA|nr:pep-cterm sorting domain-containing protein [Anaeramoeba flamelloides]
MTLNFPIQPKNKKEKTIWCDVCLKEDNKKVEAKVYCQNCEENQCENCNLVHKSRRFRNHVRTDLKQAKTTDDQDQDPADSNDNFTEKCPIHQKSKLSRYCKNCQKLICDECGFEHINHETISFDQSMDFYQELIKEQKQCTQNHFERINENLEQLNNSEKGMKSNKEKILGEISNFYLKQKKLLDLLEQNEIKLTNDFFEQISSIMKIEKQKINNSKSTTQKILNEFKKLETNINQSNSIGFFKLFSEMQLTKKSKKNNKIAQEKPNPQFSGLCNKHKNKPYQYFCIDHKKLLCVDCRTLNHRKCNQVVNFKVGYEIIQNKLEKLIKKINSINEKKLEFVQKIQSEKLKCLKEKQINLELVKKNYQKINKLTQYQFKKMNKEISIQQNEKFIQLNNQSNKIQKDIEVFEVSQMIIKEIEICKKYNDYPKILLNFSKLKQLLPILNKNKKNKLICNSKFDRINLIPNDLKHNLKNWKLNLPIDLNKTKINLPDEIQLKNKLKFSIVLKNKFNEVINAQKFNPKAEIFKLNSKEIITEITKFQEGKKQERIGEYLFKKEGEYQINFSINGQKFPKSPFKVKVIDHIYLEESEILQKENNLKFNQILEKWIKKAGCKSDLQRRFNSRTDGWKNKTFHKKCDNKGKSIVLVKLKNKSLFGGFAATGWNSKIECKQSKRNKSFLFSLISLDPNFTEPLKMHIYLNTFREIYCDPDCGPTFGRGSDLSIGRGKEDMNEHNYSNLGDTYKPPFGYKFESARAQNFLAGSHKFWDISQIEIFCEK